MGAVRLMKYKVGDKVRIKKDISYSNFLIKRLEKHNYILTIVKVKYDFLDDFSIIKYYIVKEIKFTVIKSSFIEGLYEPIKSRFDLLDL